MTAIPFDEHPPSEPSPAARLGSPNGRPYHSDSMERAVAELLQHGVLSHAFGQRGEYKVRTTIATRQAWQYRCYVLRHGKALKKTFAPIIVDRPPQVSHIPSELGYTRAMRRSFAREAVDVHFTRCATLQEYLLLSTIYSQPPPELRRPYALLVLLISVVCLTAYGFWAYALRTKSGQPPGTPPAAVQGATHSGSDRQPAGLLQSALLSTFRNESNRTIRSEQTAAPNITPPAPPPKAIPLTDLLSLEAPRVRANRTSRAATPRAPAGSTASGVQAGDALLLTGWIHRVSRAPDSTYRLQISPGRKAGSPGLIAVVPPPDQVSESPAVRAQLQDVRAFVTRRLLQEQEPSPRGLAMRKPIFVQLTGQLSPPDPRLSEPAQGKIGRDTRARWELRPVLDIQFATPSGTSDRSRPQ
jgi:hypothetical protein